MAAVRSLGLVFLGGAAGTLARYGAGLAVGSVGGLPVATFVVNLVGAFALGLLLASVAAAPARLLWGTGFCGGFTTYSALALESVLMADAVRAVGYVVVTVVLGAAAAGVGVRLGGRLARGRR